MNLSVNLHTYAISSVVVRLGERTSEGHYRNLMCDETLQCWLSADDGSEAARGNADDMSKGQTDSSVHSYVLQSSFVFMSPCKACLVVRDGAICLTWDA